MPLYVAAILGVLFVLSRVYAMKIPPSLLTLVIPALGFSAMVAVRASPMLVVLNIVATLFLLLLLAQALFGKKIHAYTAGSYIGMAFLPLMFFWRSIEPIAEIAAIRRNTTTDGYWYQAAKGIAMAAPFLLLFIVLFSW